MESDNKLNVNVDLTEYHLNFIDKKHHFSSPV